jgi:hypothetical protein
MRISCGLVVFVAARIKMDDPPHAIYGIGDEGFHRMLQFVALG